MSYERLAGRLVEAQESTLGRRALAESIDGITLDDDGTVTDIDGGDAHDRTVVAALVDAYVSIVGQSAHDSPDEIVAEFDDLILPENLGGPAEIPDVEATAASDGSAAATDPDPGADADSDPDDRSEPADPDELVTDIWGEEHESEAKETDADPADVDVESVYITVTDEGGWEQPVLIGRALVEPVTNVTDLTEEDLADLSTYVDTHRIVRLLETDATDPVSFEVEGHRVTLHADGGVLVE
jgi:hypothetical protein